MKRLGPGNPAFVILADGVSSTSYVDTIPASGSAYAYCVLAENSNGVSEPSNVVVAGGGSIATVSVGQVQLTWTESGTESGYIVQRSDAGVGNWSTLVAVAPGVTSYFDVTAVPGSSYVYRIDAVNPGGSSTTLASLPLTRAPSGPVLLTATPASGARIKLSWTSSNGSTGYIVQRSADGLTNWFTIGATSATTFSDNSPSSGATWYYRVLATNAGGSDPSETAVATAQGTPTPSPTPTPTPAPAPTPTQITGGFAPSADTYVQDGSDANVNYGTASQLLVKDAVAGNGYVRTAYFQFNLAGLAPITNAALELYGSELPGTSIESSINIAAYAVSRSTWAQNSITDANAPAFGGAPLATIAVSGTAARLYSFNLTAYLQQQQALGNTTASIALTGIKYTNGIVAFNSTNAASNGPALLVNQ